MPSFKRYKSLSWFLTTRNFFACCLLLSATVAAGEDGYRLWLRYDRLNNKALLTTYRNALKEITVFGNSAVLNSAKEEITAGLEGILNEKFIVSNNVADHSLVIGTPSASPFIHSIIRAELFNNAAKDGFIIRSVLSGSKKLIVITANNDAGILYGIFHFLRLIQTQQSITNLNIVSSPKIQNRILDHWDNLNRTVERGYAGISIFNWHTLPGYIDKRYKDYARANASIGINGTVVTNVNANSLALTKDYLIKVAALANVFRPYNIKVYLTAKFSAPVDIGGLKTADPLNTDVQNWWKEKVNEIYQYIPDFGGFLVKANSEGQPGPQTYNRTHADGANMLADAVASHGGIIMWRAFVYSNEKAEDRFKQAYNEFKSFDGKFRTNVLVQVKNGPIDFQPREPFSPLFGAMPQTPLAMEFQLTQEYLGQGTHLVYEAPLFKETLEADTYANGKGSTVAKATDGSLEHHSLTAIAGVSNIGNERNWTNHPFAQANWYAFGRLAWDHDLSAEQIADEWARQTFTNDDQTVSTIKKIMLASREAVVNYMTPLGLHHIMGTGHHYGPAPWIKNAGRADWNPVYYHRADSIGIGFDRTVTGSNALSQYAPQVREKFENLTTCPDEYLLWFHHLPWQYKMRSGKILWDELCLHYQSGVDAVRNMQQQWNSLKNTIDEERFNQAKQLLAIQESDAEWWRNACLLYFQTFSKLPYPAGVEKADHTLDYYMGLKFPYAPGNGQ